MRGETQCTYLGNLVIEDQVNDMTSLLTFFTSLVNITLQ